MRAAKYLNILSILAVASLLHSAARLILFVARHCYQRLSKGETKIMNNKYIGRALQATATTLALALSLTFGVAPRAHAGVIVTPQTAPDPPGVYSQEFNESGVGNFTDMQIFLLPSQGSNLDITGLASGWTNVTHNGNWSEASGPALTSENFFVSFNYLNTPGSFDFFAFDNGTMVDSATCTFTSGSGCGNGVVDPLTNASQVYASDMASVPEPSTLMLFAAGLLCLGMTNLATRRLRGRGRV